MLDEEEETSNSKKSKKEVMTNGVNHKSPTSPLSSKICEVAKSAEEKKRPASNGISHFFRPISKTQFIKENENCKSILTVKALVHSPSSAAKIEEDEGKKKRRKASKYIRRSEETDVIQVLTKLSFI